MKVVAETLGVARSNLVDRLKGKTKPRRRYHKAQDAELVPRIATLVTSRPTYGYRRITAILNRQLRSECLAPVNHKRVYRIMQAHSLLLARTYTERPEHVHDGKVIVMHSNLRSPVGLNQWRLTGSLFGWVRVHLLEWRYRPRCLHHRCPRPRNHRLACRRKCRGQRVRHPRHHARGRRASLRNIPCACGRRDAVRQRLTLHRQGHADLRAPTWSEALLHPGPEPSEQWHVRGIREDAQARLRPSDAATRRPNRSRIDRRLDRGLQRQSPAFRAEDALASRVHRSSNRNCLSVR